MMFCELKGDDCSCKSASGSWSLPLFGCIVYKLVFLIRFRRWYCASVALSAHPLLWFHLSTSVDTTIKAKSTCSCAMATVQR